MRIPTRRLTLDELPLLIGRGAARLPSSCSACEAPVRVEIDIDCRIRGVVAYRHPPDGRLGDIACQRCRAKLANLRDHVNEEAGHAL